MKRFFCWMLLLSLLCALAVPAAARDGDLLTLVNPWNPLPEDWQVQTVDIGSGQQADKRCAQALLDMLSACREAGFKPVVRSSYRTYNRQKYLYNNKVSQWKGYGYDDETARQKAAAIVAVPGTSEHQMGLAFDLVDSGYRTLNARQADTPTQQWLMEHSWEYGFILRYPQDKQAVTGIIYEPWHYRYVGRDNAEAIYRSGLCLEEWLEQREDDRQQTEAVAAAIEGQLQEARRRSFVYLWRR